MAGYNPAAKLRAAVQRPDQSENAATALQVVSPIYGGIKAASDKAADSVYGNHETVGSDLMRGNIHGAMQGAKGTADERKAAANADAAKTNEAQYAANQGYNSQLDETGKKYLDEMDASHNDASKTYSNTIKPNLQNLMERAHRDSDSSMTLQEAMDPNNKVAAGTRDLYEKQAQNEGRSGLAGVSLMQSLGMQNMASQMGGMGPMSGGQMAALMGQNMAGAGNAMGQVQRRGQNLRDTGMDMGFQRSDQAYNQGIQAQQRFGDTTANYEGAAGRQRSLDEGNYGLHNAMANQGILRQQAAETQKYGGDMSNINAQISQANADKERQASLGKGVIQAGGTAAGAYFGGAGGAAAGNKAGKVAGDEAYANEDEEDGNSLTDKDTPPTAVNRQGMLGKYTRRKAG